MAARLKILTYPLEQQRFELGEHFFDEFDRTLSSKNRFALSIIERFHLIAEHNAGYFEARGNHRFERVTLALIRDWTDDK